MLNTYMRHGKVPEEWQTGLVFPIWKRKGDVQGPGKYRTSKSPHEAAREDPGWEDPKENRAIMV